MVANSGILGASFFCSRDYLGRKELKNIFPTLAYQLACRYPAFRTHIIRVIKQDPSVAQHSLISQLKDLIVDPLSSTNLSCVIVIDALDECIDDQPASAILSVLGRHVKELSLVKFFITGRPEPRIRTGFRLPLLEPLTQIFLLHEVKPPRVDDDIRLYLHEKLSAAAKRRSGFDVSDTWPCENDLAALTKKSSGLFIFASTLVRFIESEHHEPGERLQLIVTPSDSTIHEGRAGIDLLYTQVLRLAFSDVKEATVFTNLRRVLGAVILAFNPLSRKQIAGILGINSFLITTTLRHLHSVLLVPNEDSREIRVFHKSFPDFLQDPLRCSDPKFFVDSPVHHGDIALDCLELLKKLRSNPCDLPDFVMNRDVANLPELLEKTVGSAKRYACSYWTLHIRSSPVTEDYATRLIPSATEFFAEKAAQWIEVMSLENRLESVIHSIYNLLEWLGMINVSVSNLRSLAEDCLRFTMHFFHPIQQSASHIYHSALPLSPRLSKFRPQTTSRNTKIMWFYGRSDAWGIVARTITAGSKHFTCVATFGQKIAGTCDDGTVGIYDSTTGAPRLSLNLTDAVQAVRGSPDGSLLFCAHKTPSITVWDMQTGGLIHTFVLGRNVEDIAVSLDGSYLACGFSDRSLEVREVGENMGGDAIWSGSPVDRFCWLKPEKLLAVSAGELIHICDINAGTVLRSYAMDDPPDHKVYSQRSSRLAVMTNLTPKTTMTIIGPLKTRQEVRPVVNSRRAPKSYKIHLDSFQTLDGFLPIFTQKSSGSNQTSSPTSQDHTIMDPHMKRDITTRQVPQKFTCFAFSHTAQKFVCGTEGHGLSLFDIQDGSLERIEHPGTITFVSSLQNGTVVANSVGSGIQLLSLDGYAPSQQPAISALAVHAFDRDRIIAIFPTSRDHILLLDWANMLELFNIPIRNARITLTDHSTILCASHKNRVAVDYFEEGNRGFLRLWRFSKRDPRWTVEVDGVPEIGRISPSGTRLVTFHHVDNRKYVCVWGAQNGLLEAQLQVDPIRPLDITFNSETQFYSHHDTYRIPFVVFSSSSEDRSHSHRNTSHTPSSTRRSTLSHQITCSRQLPLVRKPQKRRYYDIDETREWVVSDSKRVCWIPPGYLGPVQPGYHWIGDSLAMIGEDGTLRKLLFQKPP